MKLSLNIILLAVSLASAAALTAWAIPIASSTCSSVNKCGNAVKRSRTPTVQVNPGPLPALLRRHEPEYEVVKYVDGKHKYVVKKPETITSNGLDLGVGLESAVKRNTIRYTSDPALTTDVDVGSETTTEPEKVIVHPGYHRPTFVKPETVQNSLLNVSAVVGGTNVKSI